jgi:hypothetical protein
MQAVVHALATFSTVVVTICAAAASVRWAKRHSAGSQVMAGAMLLILGISMPVVKRPQQGLEEAREDKGTKGAQSGDPPAA